MIAVPTWLLWLVALALFAVIALGGVGLMRAIVLSRPQEKIEPEEVSDLDVFLTCGECGTEYQVTRLGQIQIPRHCGEPMSVVRRPRQQPPRN